MGKSPGNRRKTVHGSDTHTNRMRELPLLPLHNNELRVYKWSLTKNGMTLFYTRLLKDSEKRESIQNLFISNMFIGSVKKVRNHAPLEVCRSQLSPFLTSLKIERLSEEQSRHLSSIHLHNHAGEARETFKVTALVNEAYKRTSRPILSAMKTMYATEYVKKCIFPYNAWNLFLKTWKNFMECCFMPLSWGTQYIKIFKVCTSTGYQWPIEKRQGRNLPRTTATLIWIIRNSFWLWRRLLTLRSMSPYSKHSSNSLL